MEERRGSITASRAHALLTGGDCEGAAELVHRRALFFTQRTCAYAVPGVGSLSTPCRLPRILYKDGQGRTVPRQLMLAQQN